MSERLQEQVAAGTGAARGVDPAEALTAGNGGELHTSPTAERRARDLLLGALTISSGAVDAISFVALGKVFTAFMTGNVAFLGLRVAGSSVAPGAEAILASMGAFAVGVFLSTRLLMRFKGSSDTWPRSVTLALGVSLIPHAAFVVVWLAAGGQPSLHGIHVLLALWALAMGIQSAAVRSLHVEGVFTTAATATIIVLVGDIANWPVTGVERRRLAVVLVSLFIGATAGSLLLMHARIHAPLLPFVLTIGVVATAAVVFRGRPDPAR
jgi:uncharacterized membrane protein YoaK (UPF0700 family)